MSFWGYIMVSLFPLLVFFGCPIALALGGSAIVYILMNGIVIDIVAIKMVYSLFPFPLMAICMFMLAGNFMNLTGVTDRIFNFCRDLFGHIPGALGHVNIFGSLIFAGMSGSALADVGGLGNVEIQAMKDAGYPADVACATTVASATVGPIFPPSIPLVIYGVATETSILKLLIGGILPGIIITGLLMVLFAILTKRHKYPRDREKHLPLRQVGHSLRNSVLPLLAPGILIGGMLSGYFTPTETAAISVAYAGILGVLYERLSFSATYEMFKSTARSVAMILFIIAAASLFGWAMTLEGIPEVIRGLLLSISSNKYILLLILNILLLIAGCFISDSVTILILGPIVAPVFIKIGVDPVHLGVIFVYNLMIGLITPPYCLSIYLASHVGGETAERVIKATLPYLIPLLLGLGLVTYLPQIVTFLPNLLID